MKLKSALLSALLLASTPAFADQYLCSYTAQISENDKYNSSGVYLGNHYNKAAVAAILRQDRANYYVFGMADRLDTSDCVMHNKASRATFERLLNNSRMSAGFIRNIINGNPVIDVDLYRNHIEARIRSF